MKLSLFRFFRRSLRATLMVCVLMFLAREAAASTWIQLSPAATPPARSYLAMTYDRASQKIVLFGGFDGRGYLNDTWTLMEPPGLG